VSTAKKRIFESYIFVEGHIFQLYWVYSLPYKRYRSTPYPKLEKYACDTFWDILYKPILPIFFRVTFILLSPEIEKELQLHENWTSPPTKQYQDKTKSKNHNYIYIHHINYYHRKNNLLTAETTFENSK